LFILQSEISSALALKPQPKGQNLSIMTGHSYELLEAEYRREVSSGQLRGMFNVKKTALAEN